jgi:hypothetical protein
MTVIAASHNLFAGNGHVRANLFLAVAPENRFIAAGGSEFKAAS